MGKFKKIRLIALTLALILSITACGATTQVHETVSEDGVTLSDDSSDFALLSEAVPDAILEIRYYSTYNFVGDRIDGYEEPLALLTKEAASALKEVSDELLTMGFRLKIFDAYRPQMAVTHFMNWALDADDTRMKEYFYPELDKEALFPQGYIAEHSGHSRGSTVDLTLFDMAAEKEADMGGTFDYFGELSHPDYTGITREQYANRMILREVMLKHGFKPLAEEWWHFTLENEPYPDTYFTFPINSDSIKSAYAPPQPSAANAVTQSANDNETVSKPESVDNANAGLSDLWTNAALSLWTDAAPAKAALTAYMDAITDENGAEFIPVENRIAVFDLDGTLFCETDPNYFDYTLLKYRVLEDPDYQDKASDFEKEVANKIKEQNETGQSFTGLEVDHGRAVASAFSGMTVQEFNDYIQEFKKQPMPSYDGMLRGEGWYQPMLEIVDYLKEHDFKVYIVSGTDRLIVRGIAYDSPLNLPNSQIIGSDETLVATGQGNEDGLNYVFTDGDQLVLGGDFLIKNLKMNKVSVIMQEIGQQPVLSFGNSTGDSSMAEYVTSGNPYKSLAFMLCCDDTERENGDEAKAQKMFDLCEEFDWVPISMKNDWTTIYGDGVTKK
ncbi:MAG: haloacid dehalogenase-like hydrolase [Oscillibacter sp.]|nr:haloacid dehalogenase-like hydrolase [Oscillibacter sp.]